MASGATHTLSTAVIVFELTGQLHHLLPVLLGVLVAYSVSGTPSAVPPSTASAHSPTRTPITPGALTLSIYDVLLTLKKLPNLAAVQSKFLYRFTAQDLMTQDVGFLTVHSTYADAEALVRDRAPHLTSKPTLMPPAAPAATRTRGPAAVSDPAGR